MSAVPDDRGDAGIAPSPTSTPKNKDLADSTPGLSFRSPDPPDHRIPDALALLRVSAPPVV